MADFNEHSNGHVYPWQEHNEKLLNGYHVIEPTTHELGVTDPRNQFENAPSYEFGKLPEVYEDYIRDNIAEYGGDPAAYACAFLAVICGVFHCSIEMQTRPSRNNWKAPNEHSLTLGSSGSNKSGMFKDLTKFQLLWQEAIIRASARTGKSRAARPPQILLQ